MKKNYFSKKTACAMVCAMLASIGVNAQITTFPWTETFEESSLTRADWTQIYEVNNMSWSFAAEASTGGWGIPAYEGDLMANYPATSHNFDKTKLVSPVMDMSSIGNPTLTFYYRNPFWDPDQNWLRIFYRTSDVSEWVQIAEFHEDIDDWTSSGTLDLPTPSATYQIAIEVETDYGYSTVVDAVTVDGTPLSVEERTAVNVGYFPNPAENVLNFSGNEKINEIRIFTLLGQQVLDFNVHNKMGQVDVSSLSTGNYIVQAITDRGTHAAKLAKK